MPDQPELSENDCSCLARHSLQEKSKAEILLFAGLHSVEKLVTQGQRPEAECKDFPREILHQLPFPGSLSPGTCWHGEFSQCFSVAHASAEGLPLRARVQ